MEQQQFAWRRLIITPDTFGLVGFASVVLKVLSAALFSHFLLSLRFFLDAVLPDLLIQQPPVHAEHFCRLRFVSLRGP